MNLSVKSAGEILSELINFVEQSGVKYAALYVSDPLRSPHYPSSQELGRFLAENASGNQSANSTICDEVCQIKSSLLEGLLVVSCWLSISHKKFSFDGAFVLLLNLYFVNILTFGRSIWQITCLFESVPLHDGLGYLCLFIVLQCLCKKYQVLIR